jgi:hypothetical protein
MQSATREMPAESLHVACRARTRMADVRSSNENSEVRAKAPSAAA